jgi:hypothetical protein
MIRRVIFSLLLAGPAFAFPPPPGSPGYVPPPPFIDVDFDGVLQRVLKGIWETQPNTPGIKFEIIGRKPHHFKLRILSQPSCKALPVDQYALTVGYAQPLSATDFRITRAQIKFDGDREKTNCLGMPAWVTFEFASPLNHNAAKVTVREQFVEGPDENEYEMIHHK